MRVSIAVAAALVATLATPPGGARAAELADLLRTPAERAAAALESEGGRARLVERAPDSEWAAHARYRDGDPDAAIAGFDAALAAEDDPDERHRLGYNRATALVRAGRAEEAIERFDELLEARPDDVEAAANREVARRLAAPRERASEGGETGTEGETAEAGEPDGGGEPSGSAEPAESGAPGDGAGNPSGGGPGTGEAAAGSGGTRPGPEEGNRGGPSSDEVSADAISGGAEASADGAGAASGEGGASAAAPDASDARDAAAALDAGDAATGEADGAPDGTDGEGAGSDGGQDREDAGPDPDGVPLGEREQAVEQWLRRIPDDPAGLMRGKLLQSHRRDWPDVTEGGGGL